MHLTLLTFLALFIGCLTNLGIDIDPGTGQNTLIRKMTGTRYESRTRAPSGEIGTTTPGLDMPIFKTNHSEAVRNGTLDVGRNTSDVKVARFRPPDSEPNLYDVIFLLILAVVLLNVARCIREDE